jgi:hypothetical protein
VVCVKIEVEDEKRHGLSEQLRSDLWFWEKNFESAGRLREAGEVRRELIELDRNYPDEQGSIAGPVLKLQGWWSWAWNDHGTDPYRPILIVSGIIVFFGALYRGGNAFEQADPAKKPKDKGPLWLFSCLYSVDVFVPFKIAAGVKDWGWKIKDSWRWVELTERMVGTIINVFAAIEYLL